MRACMRPAAAWRVGDGIESREGDEDPEARVGGVLVYGIPAARDRSCIGYVRTYYYSGSVHPPRVCMLRFLYESKPRSTVMLELARRRAQVVVQDDVDGNNRVARARWLLNRPVHGHIRFEG